MSTKQSTAVVLRQTGCVLPSSDCALSTIDNSTLTSSSHVPIKNANAARQRENVGTSRRQYRKNATASSASRNQLLFHRKRVQTAAFTKISAVSVAAVSRMARRGERKNSITGAKQSTAAGYRAVKSRKYRRNSSQSIRRPPKLPSAYGGTDTA